MSDLIAAISTALAPSGIGVIRLSGPGCDKAAEAVLSSVYGAQLSAAPSRKLCLYDLRDRRGQVIDRILAVRTPGPGSYTGEDTVELQCHGSPAVLAAALDHLFVVGFRQAQPGEFTKRAFLNGRMDLTAAEAVIDLIEAESADAAANAAGQVAGAIQRRLDPVYEALISVMSHFHAVLDYPDEDLDDFQLSAYGELLEKQKEQLEALLDTCQRGSQVKNGVGTVILGRPNVGKSSLLNALVGFERAIVTDIPGTTRDTVEERLRLGEGGLLLRLIDTAGIRDAGDTVERLGVERTLRAARDADLALVVIDGSQPLAGEDLRAMEAARAVPNAICVLNKADLPQRISPAELDFPCVISVSAATGEGIQALSVAMAAPFASCIPVDGSLLTNRRQAAAIASARDAISRAQAGIACGQTPDAVLLEVEAALESIGTVTGRVMREDITNDIFSRFCVGK